MDRYGCSAAAVPNGGTTFTTPTSVDNPTACEEILAKLSAEETFQGFAPTYVTYTNAESENKAFITSRISSASGEGLLLDTGAVQNMCGEYWLDRTAQEFNTQTGKRINVKYDVLQNPTSISGIGAGALQVKSMCTVPISVTPGQSSTFRCALVSGSHAPALLGVDSLRDLNAVIDPRQGQDVLWIADNIDDIRITAGPTASRIQLERAQSGHLMVPCTKYTPQPPVSNL